MDNSSPTLTGAAKTNTSAVRQIMEELSGLCGQVDGQAHLLADYASRLLGEIPSDPKKGEVAAQNMPSYGGLVGELQFLIMRMRDTVMTNKVTIERLSAL